MAYHCLFSQAGARIKGIRRHLRILEDHWRQAGELARAGYLEQSERVMGFIFGYLDAFNALGIEGLDDAWEHHRHHFEDRDRKSKAKQADCGD